MAYYRSDAASGGLPFSIPVSGRDEEGIPLPHSFFSISVSSLSEQRDIIVYVGRVNTQRRKSFKFLRHDKICNLTEKIQESFGLDKQEDIVLYKHASEPGTISECIPGMDDLEQYNNEELVFHVPGPVDLEEIKMSSCGQNIVLLGEPGHGKSSFINTIMKSLGIQPSAQTFGDAGSGTPVYTRYRIPSKDKPLFTLWDVPGQTTNAFPRDKLKATILSILRGREPENVHIGCGTNWFSKNYRKIHAIISIQSGTAAMTNLHSIFLEAATSVGRTIPMFIVMTCIDKMTLSEMKSKETSMARQVGIDPSCIFKIANYDQYCEIAIRTKEDPQRDFHTRSILMKILAASKSYKEETKDSGDCSII